MRAGVFEFAGRSAVRAKRGDQFRAHPGTGNRHHAEGPRDQTLLNHDALTRMKFTGRLGHEIVDLHTAGTASVRGQAAGLEQPHRPQPLIEPCGGAGGIRGRWVIDRVTHIYFELRNSDRSQSSRRVFSCRMASWLLIEDPIMNPILRNSRLPCLSTLPCASTNRNVRSMRGG